jgi:hypothetical protein
MEHDDMVDLENAATYPMACCSILRNQSSLARGSFDAWFALPRLDIFSKSTVCYGMQYIQERMPAGVTVEDIMAKAAALLATHQFASPRTVEDLKRLKPQLLPLFQDKEAVYVVPLTPLTQFPNVTSSPE